MNRLELIQALAAAEAFAEVVREALGNEARTELEDNGMAPTWRTPGGGVTLSCGTNRSWVSVHDESAWLKWCKEREPDQVEILERVRPAWQSMYLKAVAKRGFPPQAKDGEVIECLSWHEGGGYRSISLLVADDVKERLADAAREMVAGVRPLALPGVAE
mgnify:CR=1 FL=1